MTMEDALHAVCNALGIKPPRARTVGRWMRTDTLERNGKGDAEVIIEGDRVSAVNWQTQARKTVFLDGKATDTYQPIRDPERDRQREQERREVAAVCARLVAAATPERHAYLARKGFPDELGLVLENPAALMPERLARALPEADGPFLIVPGRVGQTITTVQFITAGGEKKNILGGQMSGACHRIATGAETWVCEGIATALSVRAALRLLGRSATVLSAFSASNVAKVAQGIPGAVIAADHDKPVETLGGLGTGEFYARSSGRTWVQPPSLGDFNDYHVSEGLRAVAVHLREVRT
jgi:putative DNA primase/helicase